MVICSYFFVHVLYNFLQNVVCRYHIWKCRTTFNLSTQHFCHTTRLNISTGFMVPVTVTDSTILSNHFTAVYLDSRDCDWVNSPTKHINLHLHTRNVQCTRNGVFSPPLFLNLFDEYLVFVTRLLNYGRGIFSRSDMNSADFASYWEAQGESTDGLAAETYGHINSAGCEGMATTVTTAHRSIWRHLFDSMHAAQKPESQLKFVTLDNESNIIRCGDEKSF